MSVDYERKYATADAIYLELYSLSDGQPVNIASFEAGDVQIAKDGGAYANMDQSLLVQNGTTGSYKLTISGADTTCKVAQIKFKDVTVPAAYLTRILTLETYGHASAQHPFDKGSFTVQSVANVAAVQSVTGNVTANPVTLAAVTHTGAVIPTVTATGSVTNLSPTVVLEQIRTALRVDPQAEVTVAPVTTSATITQMLNFIACHVINAGDSGNGTIDVRGSGGNVIATATAVDTGTLFQKGKFGA